MNFKQQQRQAWEREMARYEARIASRKSSRKRGSTAKSVVKSGVVYRETPNYPSILTMGGSTEKKDNLRYTGQKLVGIGMMHKSNLVPIFSEDEAKDVSTMRRN